MKITNEIPPIYTKQGVGPGQGVEKATESQPSAAKRGDTVNLSSKARELQAAQQAVRQMPEVDMEKVAKIKAQLEEGTYQVDAAKAASNLLADALIHTKD